MRHPSKSHTDRQFNHAHYKTTFYSNPLILNPKENLQSKQRCYGHGGNWVEPKRRSCERRIKRGSRKRWWIHGSRGNCSGMFSRLTSATITKHFVLVLLQNRILGFPSRLFKQSRLPVVRETRALNSDRPRCLVSVRSSRALLCSFVRSLACSLPSLWERGLCLWNERVDFIQIQPTVRWYSALVCILTSA